MSRTASAIVTGGVFAALAVRFNDKAVSVEQTVFNAARIVKLSSRTSRKGRRQVVLLPCRRRDLFQAGIVCFSLRARGSWAEIGRSTPADWFRRGSEASALTFRRGAPSF